MSTRAAYVTAWGLIAATLALGLLVYPALPDVVATHWNASGMPNGSMPAFLGVLFMPLVMGLAVALFASVPHIDPLRRNIRSFRPQFNIFVVLFTLVLALIQAAVLFANLGARFNIMSVIMPAVGALFIAIGSFLPDTRRNWFIGIRTPWTISSDIVWKRTHELAGRLFKVLGVVAMLTVLAPAYALIVFFTPLIVAVIGLVIYSFAVYREVGMHYQH